MEVVHVKITGEFHYVYDYFVLKVLLEIKGGFSCINSHFSYTFVIVVMSLYFH